VRRERLGGKERKEKGRNLGQETGRKEEKGRGGKLGS
jgi:hypothetical protein